LQVDRRIRGHRGLHFAQQSFWCSKSYRLTLPYWLLILICAIAPALWLRRHYIERREKNFFEKIKREKALHHPEA